MEASPPPLPSGPDGGAPREPGERSEPRPSQQGPVEPLHEELPPPLPSAGPARQQRRSWRLATGSPRPWVTLAILAANVAIQVMGTAGGDMPADWMMLRLGQDRDAVWAGEYWRLITGTFVHAGIGHLIMNMLLLVPLGTMLERLLGHVVFGAWYLICGIAGSLLFQVVSDAPLGLGASGAVYGSFGTYLALKCAARGSTPLRRLGHYALWTVMIQSADLVLATFLEIEAGVGIATSAHVGGFIAGSLLGYLSIRKVFPERPASRILRWAAGSLLLAGLGALGAHAAIVAPEGEELQHFARGRRIQEKLVKRDTLGAVEEWRASAERGSDADRAVGYGLYEELRADGHDDLAAEVLDELIELSMEALRPKGRKEPVDPDLLNEVAWLWALRGTNLADAKHLADQAVGAARSALIEWPWTLVFSQNDVRARLSMYLNTRGWVEFRLGQDPTRALLDLREAAELYPLGPNHLYLALASYGLNRIDEAREAARQARESGGLSRYEEILLSELEASLGGR